MAEKDAALLLEHIGQKDAAERVLRGVRKVVKDGKRVTYDLGGTAGTSQMGEAVIETMRA